MASQKSPTRRISHGGALGNDFPFRGADAPRLTAIAIAAMLLFRLAALIVLSFQVVGHFLSADIEQWQGRPSTEPA